MLIFRLFAAMVRGLLHLAVGRPTAFTAVPAEAADRLATRPGPAIDDQLGHKSEALEMLVGAGLGGCSYDCSATRRACARPANRRLAGARCLVRVSSSSVTVPPRARAVQLRARLGSEFGRLERLRKRRRVGQPRILRPASTVAAHRAAPLRGGRAASAQAPWERGVPADTTASPGPATAGRSRSRAGLKQYQLGLSRPAPPQNEVQQPRAATVTPWTNTQTTAGPVRRTTPCAKLHQRGRRQPRGHYPRQTRC